MGFCFMSQTGISFLYKEQSAVIVRVDDLLVIQITRENMNGTITQVWIKLDKAQEQNLIEFLTNEN
jgi:hypothetical protein